MAVTSAAAFSHELFLAALIGSAWIGLTWAFSRISFLQPEKQETVPYRILAVLWKQRGYASLLSALTSICCRGSQVFPCGLTFVCIWISFRDC